MKATSSESSVEGVEVLTALCVSPDECLMSATTGMVSNVELDFVTANMLCEALQCRQSPASTAESDTFFVDGPYCPQDSVDVADMPVNFVSNVLLKEFSDLSVEGVFVDSHTNFKSDRYEDENLVFDYQFSGCTADVYGCMSNNLFDLDPGIMSADNTALTRNMQTCHLPDDEPDYPTCLSELSVGPLSAELSQIAHQSSHYFMPISTSECGSQLSADTSTQCLGPYSHTSHDRLSTDVSDQSNTEDISETRAKFEEAVLLLDFFQVVM